VGLALSDKMQGRRRVTCCFFGEGAVAEGEFHESLNLAKLWQLPVLFVCENNKYTMGTALELEESEQNIYRKAASYGIRARAVDGMNVVDVEAYAKVACQAIRDGDGPQFLECQTYRFRGHSMFDAQLYRDKQEIEQWKAKGPIVQLSHWLKANNQLSDEQLKQMELRVEQEIQRAVDESEAAAFEPVESLTEDVYTMDRQTGAAL
jgi:TPP-dependent pyruvate/acetoin dehydrogenase alpha subunit